jgi:hypothetical protein
VVSESVFDYQRVMLPPPGRGQAYGCALIVIRSTEVEPVNLMIEVDEVAASFRGQLRSPPRPPVRPAPRRLYLALPQLAWAHLKAVEQVLVGSSNGERPR